MLLLLVPAFPERHFFRAGSTAEEALARPRRGHRRGGAAAEAAAGQAATGAGAMANETNQPLPAAAASFCFWGVLGCLLGGVWQRDRFRFRPRRFLRFQNRQSPK